MRGIVAIAFTVSALAGCTSSAKNADSGSIRFPQGFYELTTTTSADDCSPPAKPTHTLRAFIRVAGDRQFAVVPFEALDRSRLDGGIPFISVFSQDVHADHPTVYSYSAGCVDRVNRFALVSQSAENVEASWELSWANLRLNDAGLCDDDPCPDGGCNMAGFPQPDADGGVADAAYVFHPYALPVDAPCATTTKSHLRLLERCESPCDWGIGWVDAGGYQATREICQCP